MSFVLDALKRNASDTQAGSVPTLHSQAPMTLSAKRRDWSGPLLFTSSFALLVATLAYVQPWLLVAQSDNMTDVSVAASPQPLRLLGKIDAQRYPPRQKVTQPIQQVVAASEPMPSNTQTGTLAALPEPQLDEQVVSPTLKALFDQAVRDVEPVALASAPSSTGRELEAHREAEAAPAVTGDAVAELVPLTRKPLAFQDQIPSLSFQAHLYSSDPEKRWIKVNGQAQREGDWLTPSLQLIAIEPDRLVLEQNSQPFTLPALTDW